MNEPVASATAVARAPLWLRVLWLTGGSLSLVTGLVGIFLPLLPTTPFVLLAAFCFSRGCARCEAWMLAHPRFGPMVRNWRAYRAIPLRAKQFAIAMMAAGSAWAWVAMPPRIQWLPALVCTTVAVWMWRLPSRPPPLQEPQQPPEPRGAPPSA